MNLIKIDSSKITDEVFKDYEARYGYKFSKGLRAELRKAFKGEVALAKFRPHKENSQAKILLAAFDKDLEIPTCKEWGAILLTAESLAAKGDKKAEKLLNDRKNGMLYNEIEITSTALVYNSGQKVPASVIDNVMLAGEESTELKWFPDESDYLPKGKEVSELGLPEHAHVWVSPPKKGGLRSVFWGDWDVPRGEGRFGTSASGGRWCRFLTWLPA